MKKWEFRWIEQCFAKALRPGGVSCAQRMKHGPGDWDTAPKRCWRSERHGLARSCVPQPCQEFGWLGKCVGKQIYSSDAYL